MRKKGFKLILVYFTLINNVKLTINLLMYNTKCIFFKFYYVLSTFVSATM